jgi:hypothetical protein
VVVSTPPRVAAASIPAAVGNLYGRGARGPQTPPTPVPPAAAAAAAPVVPVVDAAQLRFEACDPNLDSLVGHPVRNSKVSETLFGRRGFLMQFFSYAFGIASKFNKVGPNDMR